MPKHGARVQFLLGTNVNTPFAKYSHQNSGTVPMFVYKVFIFYSGTRWYLVTWSTSVRMQHYFKLMPRHQGSGTKCEHILRLEW